MRNEFNAFRRHRSWRNYDTQLTIIALPAILYFLVFSYLPLLGILMSFKHYRIFQGRGFFYSLIQSPWAGFTNFSFFVKGPDFLIMLRNTVCYNIAFIILGVVLPVGLSLMINELFSKLKSKVYQTAMFFPYFMSWVVVAYFVYAFLNVNNGMVNRMIMSHGGKGIDWFNDGTWWPVILIFLSQWKGVGYGMIVYLATITGIDRSLYEAAVVDGASKWQQAIHITLPQLRTIIVIMFIMAVGRIFSSDFGLFYQVTQGIPLGLNNVAQTFDTYVYQALRTAGMDVGHTTAITTLQSIASLVMILGANAIVRKISPDDAMI